VRNTNTDIAPTAEKLLSYGFSERENKVNPFGIKRGIFNVIKKLQRLLSLM